MKKGRYSLDNDFAFFFERGRAFSASIIFMLVSFGEVSYLSFIKGTLALNVLVIFRTKSLFGSSKSLRTVILNKIFPKTLKVNFLLLILK